MSAVPGNNSIHAEYRGRKVLIVDRHPVVRSMLRDLVATLGVTSIFMAGSSHDVKRHVGSTTFDMIFCDYLLEPHKDGQQLLEELRHTRAIPLSTIFMIVTGERAYQSVVSVAELAPDDYLLKPFTPEHLAQRLHKALEKKHAFRIAHDLIEAGKPGEAIVECEVIARGHSRYLFDALRLKAELLVGLGEQDAAGELYRQILEHKVVPWARMGLAWIQYRQGQLEAAESAVTAVIEETPEYMAAYSFLAEVQEEKGDFEGALGTLDRASVHSPNNVARLRKLGELAVGARELERARNAFDRVLERAGDSDILRPEDFANAVRVAVEQGAIQDTEKYIQNLRRRFRGRKDGAFVADTLDSLCLAKRGQHAAARASLMKALDGCEALGEAVSPQLMMDLAQSCLLHDLPESALGMIEKLDACGAVLRPDLSDALDRHRRMAEFEPAAPDAGSAEAEPPAGAVAAAAQGKQGAAGKPARAASPAAADHFELAGLPAPIVPLAAASNAAEGNFDAAAETAAAMLDLIRQGRAGSPNDHACMRTVLRRMFVARSRHPITVRYHKEYAELAALPARPAAVA